MNLTKRRYDINGRLRRMCSDAGVLLAEMHNAQMEVEPEAWRAYRMLDSATQFLAAASESWSNFVEGRHPDARDRYDPQTVRQAERS